MSVSNNEYIRNSVRNNYGKIAAREKTGCGCSGTGCCDPSVVNSDEVQSANLGYSIEELKGVPEGADLGLGCGNPQAIASLKPGETVLDLGSGGGLDCFLASRTVGSNGFVIGVDMTPEMISKARESAEKGNYTNVSFRLGEIENLPVADGIVDVKISNCVINLSPEKAKVFAEAYRVLKPGGRLAVSDIVAVAELPDIIKQDMALYNSCTAGASSIKELETMLDNCGFKNIRIKSKSESKSFIREWNPGSGIEDYVLSANIEAVKPV